MTKRLAVSILPALIVLALLAWVPSLEEGIPVISEEVIENCGSCHLSDEAGIMGRISYLRKTPEGWQRSLLRMVSLQGVQLDPEVARRIVRYLSNEHGLAPEELRPAFWEVERRTVMNEAPNEIVRETCTACHSVGRILTQRRTKEEWTLLTEMHRGYYPLIDNQVYRNGEGSSADEPFPVEEALEYLVDALPLATPEWAEWSTSSRPPRLAGNWILKGWEVGRGPVFGRVEILSVPGTEDEFSTRASYTYAGEGRRVSREGEVLIYTDYQWRGSSQEVGGSAAEGSASNVGASGELREVMFVESDWSEVYGRWFAGAYDELGLDIVLRRIGSDPLLAGVYPEAVRRGTRAAEIRIYGANLPQDMEVDDVDMGPGLEVTALLGGDSESFGVRVSVDPEAPSGPRDLHLGHVTLSGALPVFDQVSRISVEPAMGMARIGGANLPAQYERFEAVGYGAGPDGETGTEDDLRLGLMDVSWGLEEYPVSFGDDDVQFVGDLDQNGVFTPAEDGPNPARTGDRNNIGDVWVTATYTPPGGDGPVLEARGQLLVTVPLYLRWDLSGVTEDLGVER